MEGTWSTQSCVLKFLTNRVYIDMHLCNIRDGAEHPNRGVYGDFSIECIALFHKHPLGSIYTPYSFLIQAGDYERIGACIRTWLPLLNVLISIVASYLDVWNSLEKLELKT